MTWLMALIGAAGLLLNIFKRWQGYLLWVVTSGYWCWRDVTIGEYAQAVMVAGFGLVALYGVFAWRKKKPQAKPPIEPSELTYQGNIQDAATINALKHRLRANNIVTSRLLNKLEYFKANQKAQTRIKPKRNAKTKKN